MAGQVDKLHRFGRLRSVVAGDRLDVAVLHHRRVRVDAAAVNQLAEQRRLSGVAWTDDENGATRRRLLSTQQEDEEDDADKGAGDDGDPELHQLRILKNDTFSGQVSSQEGLGWPRLPVGSRGCCDQMVVPVSRRLLKLTI